MGPRLYIPRTSGSFLVEISPLVLPHMLDDLQIKKFGIQISFGQNPSLLQNLANFIKNTVSVFNCNVLI